MAKVQVVINVDNEVKAAGDALIKVCEDIKAKAAIGQYVSDVMAIMVPALGEIANLPADLKANADNRKYLVMALEQMAEVFLAPAPAA